MVESKAPPANPASADEAYALELARRAAAGDLPAAQALLGLLWPAISRVVAGVMGASHPDVDDAIQQTLIAVVRALPAFRGECHPAGFACRIAARTASRARRRTRQAQALRDDFARLAALAPEVESPGEVAQGERRRQIWRELLDDLPEEQAETLVLRVLMGWSLEEVARATSVPLNTVRSRVRLAKEALRKRLESAPGLAEEVGT
ncbi:MAG: sigma-70 family RNA polymerase sigma factor [Polyangiaceae bacterium]